MLGFYCRASIAYNIMLLTFILTPSFSSPILEENAVSVRNDTCTATSSQLLHVRQLLLNCSIKKFKSINLNPPETLLSKQFCDSLSFYSMFSFKLRNKIGRSGKLILFYRIGLFILIETYSLQRVRFLTPCYRSLDLYSHLATI